MPGRQGKARVRPRKNAPEKNREWRQREITKSNWIRRMSSTEKELMKSPSQRGVALLEGWTHPIHYPALDAVDSRYRHLEALVIQGRASLRQRREFAGLNRLMQNVGEQKVRLYVLKDQLEARITKLRDLVENPGASMTQKRKAAGELKALMRKLIGVADGIERRNGPREDEE